MRLSPFTAPLTVALALAAGCATDPAAPRMESGLVPAGMDLARLRVDVTTWDDLTTTIPLELVTPAAAGSIGPGSAIIITIPDEGRFGCTANFVWASGGKRFLGAAGHCFLPADRAATHGPGADYNAAGVVVEVCVEGCEGNFRTNQLTGTWVTLGKVAYARQTFAGEDVGNDFGVVEIPKQVRDLIRLTMPVWGGPTGVQTLELGDYACHYGHGLGVGEVFVTKARIGVLTHLGIGIDESTGEHGTIFGTTVARAIEMGREARLNLALVLP